MEEWKQIIDYPNYEISNYGNVRNTLTNRILNPYKRKDYLFVNLVNSIGRKEHRVHRLVGFYFINNPNNYPDINHKDEIKSNNHYSNLEWCNKQYNNTYGTRLKRQSESIEINVYKYSLNNQFIERYKSIKDAGRKNNILPCNISNCLNNRQKTAGGFIWKYK